MALDASCLKVVKQTQELWVEVSVGGVSLGRTKIGAVPYAVSYPPVLDVEGDASFAIHSNTDSLTSGKKMLVLKTGASTQQEVFSVNNIGRTVIRKPLAIVNNGVGVQLDPTDASTGNVFRKTSKYFANEGAAAVATFDVVTITPKKAHYCQAGGQLFLTRNSGQQQIFLWHANWGIEAAANKAVTVRPISSSSSTSKPTMQFKGDTLQVTLPGYWGGFMTLNLVDRNNGLSGITWGSHFGG